MGWRFVCTLLAAWLLVSASSCDLGVRGPTTNVELSGTAAGVGMGLFLISGTIVCLADTERCFLDEEAQQAKAEINRQIQARFTAGLRRSAAGDPAGFEQICVAAYLGSPQAQYFHGLALLRQHPAADDEALPWLESAAAQGHRNADILLRQLGGQPLLPVAYGSPGRVAQDGETDDRDAAEEDEAPTPEEVVAAATARAELLCQLQNEQRVAGTLGDQ